MNPFFDEMTKLASEASDHANTYKWTNRLGVVGGFMGLGSGVARAVVHPDIQGKYRIPAAVGSALVGGLAGYAGGSMSGTVVDAMRHRVSGHYDADVAHGGADPFMYTRYAALGGAVLGGVAGLEHGSISSVIHNALMGGATTASLGGAIDWMRS